MRKSAKLSIVPILAALALSGCSGNGDNETGAHQKPVSSTKPSGDDGGLKNAVGAIKSVKGVKCARDGDGTWSASATVENGEGTPAEYLVEFAVVKEKTSEVMGSSSKTVKVAAGKSEKVSLPGLYSGDQKGLICVPRALRGDAG